MLVFRRSSPATPTFDLALGFAEGDTLTTPVVPGLQIDVTAIFDRLKVTPCSTVSRRAGVTAIGQIDTILAET